MASGKKVVLTIQKRLDVLKDLETSSVANVAKKYNVHPITIRRIKEKAVVIAEFQGKSNAEKLRRRIKKPKYEELEKRLVIWFIERRTIGDFVSDKLLLEKAAELKEQVGGCSHFKVSKGWLAKFKRRHKIRLVRAQCEKVSTDEEKKDEILEETREEREGEREEEREGDIEEMVIRIKEERGEEIEEEMVIRMKEEREEERGEEREAEMVIRMKEEREEEIEEEVVIRLKGERGEEREEEGNENERAQEYGIKVNQEEREELEDIFRRLERYKNRIPRSAQLHIEGIKLLFLGETSKNIS